MDLNHLAVYVAVAEHNSFTRAADILGLPRSAVSRRVAALEEALGVELLIRTTRHVETTSAGRRLLRDVAPLLGQLEAAVHDLPERSAEPAGELRITAPPDLGLWLLPPVLGALTVMHPAVHPVVALSNRVVDLEREGFDVALRIAMAGLPDSGLKARKLGQIGTRLYASPSYIAQHGAPANLEDVAGHRVVSRSGADIPEPFRRASVVSADDMLLGLGLVKHGVGIGLLPMFLAQEGVDAGELEVLLPDRCFGVGVLHAVFPGARELPPKSAAFRDAVVAFLDANPLPPVPGPA